MLNVKYLLPSKYVHSRSVRTKSSLDLTENFPGTQASHVALKLLLLAPTLVAYVLTSHCCFSSEHVITQFLLPRFKSNRKFVSSSHVCSWATICKNKCHNSAAVLPLISLTHFANVSLQFYSNLSYISRLNLQSTFTFWLGFVIK